MERSRDEARVRAESIRVRMQSGVPIEELVVLSDEPYGIRQQGKITVPADLGFSPFLEASALEIGAVGDLVETEYGFHIIKRCG